MKGRHGEGVRGKSLDTETPLDRLRAGGDAVTQGCGDTEEEPEETWAKGRPPPVAGRES